MSIIETLQLLREGADPRTIPIPQIDDAANAGDYKSIPVASELVEDQLVELRGEEYSYYCFGAIHHPLYRVNFREAPHTVLLRARAEESLEAIDRYLERYGAQLLALDGFRPLSVQRGLRDAFVSQAARTRFSESKELAEIEADKFYSRAPAEVLVEDPSTWYAHGTGGACDFVLCSGSRYQLEMGAIFDDMSGRSLTWFYELNEPQTETDQAAQSNRRLLFWAMMLHGWVNYPFEFFHFDFMSKDFRTQFGMQNAHGWGLESVAETANVGPVLDVS